MDDSGSASSPMPSPSVAPVPLPSTSAPTRCPELDLSVAASPLSKPRPRRQTRGKRNPKVTFDEPVVVKVIPEPQFPMKGVQQHPATRQRTWRAGLHAGAARQGAELASYEHPGGLAEAELNTTLAVKAELLALQEAEFDAQKALKETLQKMERTKKQIETRATQGTNVSRSQTLFTSLVSVDVPDSEVIGQVFRDRLLLAPPPRPKPTDKPSLQIFMPTDLFRQKPLPPAEDAFGRAFSPRPCPASSTFDLYKRQRRWEATP
ncbi:protein phosphatase 1 regulatory subunit 35 isoform X1 [Nerophis ophidion]|uniref:protein phosphatase 1 regulatory subunit 35 isoform X1 n=1 Tax=Nerophis ophidion TaxID=159077 RepID=UPI002AE09072|nr:protein phosphatase 1 regulatory subunit 35 isoform X1 [Nerophis ophidion]